MFVRGGTSNNEFRCDRCGAEYNAPDAPSVPDAVGVLPASRSVVYRRVDAVGPVPTRDILPAVPYCETTVKEALADLREAGVIEGRRDPTDGRVWLYEVSETE